MTKSSQGHDRLQSVGAGGLCHTGRMFAPSLSEQLALVAAQHLPTARLRELHGVALSTGTVEALCRWSGTAGGRPW